MRPASARTSSRAACIPTPARPRLCRRTSAPAPTLSGSHVVIGDGGADRHTLAPRPHPRHPATHWPPVAGPTLGKRAEAL